MANWKYSIQCGQVRKALFGSPNVKLPEPDKMQMFPNREVMSRSGELLGTFTFRLFPLIRTGRKSSKHRVEVQCPECLHFVPAGRLHQHIGKKTCKANNA